MARANREDTRLRADDDLETFATGDELRARYDLVVFPGHSEYMTSHAYDVVERYRDLGGRLVFLSANNFFWKVESDGSALRRIRKWRDLGRPEARLCGVQYRANDDGRRQGSYTVVAAGAAPWLFDRTGLATGSAFGETVGGYGIEIDMTSTDSPQGTIVLARVPDLFGSGLSGEMTYYENDVGAPGLHGRNARLRRLRHVLADQPDALEPLAPHARRPARTGGGRRCTVPRRRAPDRL